jgi:hypothetical protein
MIPLPTAPELAPAVVCVFCPFPPETVPDPAPEDPEDPELDTVAVAPAAVSDIMAGKLTLKVLDTPVVLSRYVKPPVNAAPIVAVHPAVSFLTLHGSSSCWPVLAGCTWVRLMYLPRRHACRRFRRLLAQRTLPSRDACLHQRQSRAELDLGT